MPSPKKAMSEGSSMLHPSLELRAKLSKVPEVTMYFWVIKVLCTTVGETFADFINGKLGDNLNTTTLVMGSLLIVALIVQFRVPEYIPVVYWVAVVLISVVGTLITDNLTDNLGVSLVASTLVFGVLLAATFGVWFAQERTLSVRSINTRRREVYYWLAILFTFALGTAAGDLVVSAIGKEEASECDAAEAQGAGSGAVRRSGARIGRGGKSVRCRRASASHHARRRYGSGARQRQ
jgi:uncharacterized membrane-anchored protein